MDGAPEALEDLLPRQEAIGVLCEESEEVESLPSEVEWCLPVPEALIVEIKSEPCVLKCDYSAARGGASYCRRC